MKRKILLGLFVLFLSVSLYLNWKLLSLFDSNEFRNRVPNWSTEEYKILEKGYETLIKNDHTPIGIYPYKIIKKDSGYTIKFQGLEYLQIGTGPFMYSEIYDGCIYYHFNKQMELIDFTSCG